MSKNKSTKRKQQLQERSINESFKFQVLWERNRKAPEVPDDNLLLMAEMESVCSLGLAKDFLTLRDIVVGVAKDKGIEPVSERCSLKGSVISYLLGITSRNPAEQESLDLSLADKENISLPFQVEVYYDNDVRNEVVSWVKERYEGVTTRLGQPILKLEKMVVHFRRVVKKNIINKKAS